jgi:hypothetical protein
MQSKLGLRAGIRLIHGDFVEKSKEIIADDSIDLIFKTRRMLRSISIYMESLPK